ncbi:MAG: phosphatase [Bacteroidetes bacterium]|nr:phosphatase [Bacteroidota bacterium]
MLVAIIDLGTNTFNLLIAQLLPSKAYQIKYSTKLPVKLGKGGINKNQLMPEAIERGIAALEEYKAIIKQYKVDRVYAFGTSAIREATNSETFLKRAADIGIGIKVISGAEEAEYIYKGVQLGLDIGNKPALIIDIGGGSTEFIIADNKRILWKHSFLLGVSRLLEMFNPSDPILPSEINAIENYLRDELKPLYSAVKQFPVNELIGSSGSFDSFAEIIAHRFHTPDVLNNKTEYSFDMNEVSTIFNELIVSNNEQRLNTKGLVLMRVNMIVLAALLVRFVVKEFKLTHMRLSTFSLKEGVMGELMK